MNKRLIRYIAIPALFAGFAACSSDSPSPNGPEPSFGSDEYTLSEPTQNFVNTDMAGTNFAFDSSPNFKMESGHILITNDDGSSSKSVKNWVLSENYTRFVATGFVANIKVGDNMNFAGVQLFKKDSYDDYRFDVYSDGKFTIRDPKGTILKLPADSSFIKKGGSNRVTVQSTDMGNVQVFVNSNLVKTIEKKDLAFKLTDCDKIAVDYNVASTASKDSPAQAWIHFESMQSAR